jgi:23S rRNA pseudouridine2605 synthase
MRLHRYIAQCGVASRRKAEELIREGRVSVNGEPVTAMGVTVGPDDVVEVDGTTLAPPSPEVYLLNKPRGVLTTLSDPGRRPTVAQLLPPSARAVKPVGRLDMDTDGLLLLTNDGELAMRLAHPRYGVEKEYRAIVQGTPDARDLERLQRGVNIEGKKTAPAEAWLASASERAGTSVLQIVLHEGRKRQVRLMCEAVGHPVVSLTRVRIGPFRLKGMAPGQMRRLGVREVEALRRSVGLE